MTSIPVAILLLMNAVLLIAGIVSQERSGKDSGSPFLCILFFCSGMPALIYQIVWQRALFAIYGVNSQSVAAVVTAFMIGLGVGSLIGGTLSKRFPRQAILIFGIAELGVALFGLFSLQLFRWASVYTSGAGLVSVVILSLVLLLVPTILMGATLPLLVEHLVMNSNRVGRSVSLLYCVNTFGSAVACYLCATFLLREFGQSGSVSLAACINALVGASAYIYVRRLVPEKTSERDTQERELPHVNILPVPLAMVLAGLSGFIALGFEISWFRVFSIASSDRAPAFALLLSTYLAGIAAGSYLLEKLGDRLDSTGVLQFAGSILLLAGALSCFLPPIVALLVSRKMPFLYSAPLFFVTAALSGSILPLLCRLAVPADKSAGQNVSLIYVSNILGSALGSLGIGFVLMQSFGLRPLSIGLSFAAAILGSFLLLFAKQRFAVLSMPTILLMAISFVAIGFSGRFYPLLYERLIFGTRPEASVPFSHLVENRNGVIGVTQDAAVFGGGVYDGYYNIDPTKDVNLVARAYALSAFCASPKNILVIGLASASWAQIFANHPQAESLDAIEINPGYLQLLPLYDVVRTFPQNPKVHVYVDDGRRWLLAHPDAHYDAIIANGTFNWRDHATGLLSVEFLKLARSHLNPGGVYYFNTTESDETIATSLHVFQYGLRVINFVAVSDAPIVIDKNRWMDVLLRYRIDGKTIFDPAGNPASEKVLSAYMALADTVNAPPRFLGMEATDSLRARTKAKRIITDDNMGQEWITNPDLTLH